MVKAVGCDSTIRRFKSGHSPYFKHLKTKVRKIEYIKYRYTSFMSRYRGPKLRITRRLGKLPGLTQKISKKTARPGQHGKTLGDGKRKTTEYGIRLEEKQIVSNLISNNCNKIKPVTPFRRRASLM